MTGMSVRVQAAALLLALASGAAPAAEPGTLDAAKEAARAFISLLQGVPKDEVRASGAVFRDGWAAVTTLAKGKECVVQLAPNRGLNVHGWEVKQHECRNV